MDCKNQFNPFELPALPMVLATRTLVGVGETAHGSGGLHSLAHAVIEDLISKGARTILFEAPHGAVERVNSLILRGQPVAAADMADLYFIWRSRENLEFFNRLSRLNQHLESPVQIIGIDIRQPVVELRAIKEYLIENSKLGLKLDSFPIQEGTLSAFRDYEVSIQTGEHKLTAAMLTSATGSLQEIIKRLKLDFDLKFERRAELVFFAEKLIRWLTNYEAMSRADVGSLSQLSVRDLGMTDTVSYFVARAAERNHSDGVHRPVVLWAHLAHVVANSESVKSTTDIFSSGPLMGSLLRMTHGLSYSVIAVTAQVVEVAARFGGSQTFHAKEASFESIIDRSEGKAVLATPEMLNEGAAVALGLTDNESDPLKEMFPDMVMEAAKHLDYIAVVPRAGALEEP